MNETYRIKGMDLTRKDLLGLEESILRALIHERTHHTIESFFYQVLGEKRKPPKDFGSEVRILVDIWKERKLPTRDPDMQWTLRYLELVEAVQSGTLPVLDTGVPQAFDETQLETANRLLFGRRSIRQWKNKRVPKRMLHRIIEAGLAAPNACNMQCQRFLILEDPKSMAIIKADVPIPPVKIVICQDMRIYDWMGFPGRSPQNIYFDAAAAADHMLLMAHALGLGGVWLTHSAKQAENLRTHLKLPKYLRMDTHIAVGWPDEATLKAARMPVKAALIEPGK